MSDFKIKLSVRCHNMILLIEKVQTKKYQVHFSRPTKPATRVMNSTD